MNEWFPGLSMVVSMCCAAGLGTAWGSDGPPPANDADAVTVPFEVACPFNYCSITEATNGDFLLMHGNQRRRSSDSGHTWSPPETMPIGVSSVIRLNSG
ncbi:MAG: hypothetical protein V2A71_10595, partial [Candidatus Eisenbacteria bacterium]